MRTKRQKLIWLVRIATRLSRTNLSVKALPWSTTQGLERFLTFLILVGRIFVVKIQSVADVNLEVRDNHGFVG